MIKFEWNQAKATSNRRKHGVSFEEAISTFYDDSATQFFDQQNSNEEDRYLLLGISGQLRVLLTSYRILNDGTTIRIISARRETKHESQFYLRDNL
ncbi:MAG: BrnT family toxin [Proteobacteria bacterium]|nr:BrnT family toxin [Pseudomonadota bacterium]